MLLQAAESIGSGWQLTSILVAIIVGIFTMSIGVWQAWQGVKQQKKELRWRQAELANKLLDELFDFEFSDDALKMIDEYHAEYCIDKGDSKKKMRISDTDVQRALFIPEKGDPEDGDRARHIQYSFDALFYYFSRFEKMIELDIIRQEDIEVPMAYYVERMAPEKNLYLNYIKYIRHHKAEAFLNRFAAWNVN